MKRIATAMALSGCISLALGVAVPSWAAEPFDATTLAVGGTYLTRSVDANSPYWNPANLYNTRGVVYLGANLGFLLGNNTLGVLDVVGMTQKPPDGAYKDFINYLASQQSYSAGVKEAIEKGLEPADPPKAVPLPLPKDFAGFARGDVGLLGINVAWGGQAAALRRDFNEESGQWVETRVPEKLNERGVSFRTFARAPGVDAFILAPEILDAIGGVNKLDSDMATELIGLNKTLTENALDFSALKERVGTIKSKLDLGMAPLLKAEGARLTLGVTQGAYLTNALSYQMPLSDFPFMAEILASRSVMIGATGKLHLASSAFGFNPTKDLVGNFLKTADGAGVNATFPGRIELINKFKLKEPIAKINGALDNFVANPASGSQALSSAADDFSKAHSMEVVSHTAGPLGFSLDLGTSVPLGYGFTAGAMLQNMPTIWPGSKINYQGSLGEGGTFLLKKVTKGSNVNEEGEFENFAYTEPFGARLGVGWEVNSGFGGLGASLEAGEAFDGIDSNNGDQTWGTPSLHLGTHVSLAHLLFLRLGGQIGGRGAFIGAGTGLSLGIARLEIGGGIEPSLRAFNFGLNLNFGL